MCSGIKSPKFTAQIFFSLSTLKFPRNQLSSPQSSNFVSKNSLNVLVATVFLQFQDCPRCLIVKLNDKIDKIYNGKKINQLLKGSCV